MVPLFSPDCGRRQRSANVRRCRRRVRARKTARPKEKRCASQSFGTSTLHPTAKRPEKPDRPSGSSVSGVVVKRAPGALPRSNKRCFSRRRTLGRRERPEPLAGSRHVFYRLTLRCKPRANTEFDRIAPSDEKRDLPTFGEACFEGNPAPALGRAFGAGRFSATETEALYGFAATFSSFSTFSVALAASFTPLEATKRCTPLFESGNGSFHAFDEISSGGT